MEDLIKREDAIKAFYDNLETSEGGTMLNDEAYLQALKDIPSAEPKQGEWIPCGERLPSEYSDEKRILVTTDVDELGVIIMPIYDVKSWYRKGYISAWMPLPEPWKGADDDAD